jgi:hypothetical protein
MSTDCLNRFYGPEAGRTVRRFGIMLAMTGTIFIGIILAWQGSKNSGIAILKGPPLAAN